MRNLSRDKQQPTGGLPDPPPRQRTPSHYAQAILERFGLGSLAARYAALCREHGTPVEVIKRRLGGGLDWRDRTVLDSPSLRNGWLVLECSRGPEGDIYRARIFRGCNSALVEACSRLQTCNDGSVVIRDTGPRNPNGAFQIVLQSPERHMVLSPVHVGMQQISQLLGCT